MCTSWDNFKGILLDVEQRFIPLKRKCESKRCKPVWMSNEALKSVRRKHKVFQRYKNKDHPAVQAANRKAARKIKSAKRKFERKLADNIKQDKKSFYAYARSKSKCITQVDSLINSNNKLLNTDIEIVECFNEYFSSVFTAEDCSDIPKTPDIFSPSNHSPCV